MIPTVAERLTRKLHREIVTDIRWYSEIKSIDERQAEKKQIYTLI
jgi:hypothetical protein